MKTGNSAMTVQEIEWATAQVTAVGEKMTFILTLTEAERQTNKSARLGPQKLRAVHNRLVAAQQNRELLPPAFDLRKFERDAALTGALAECEGAIDKIRARVHDTLLAVGNRAVLAANTAYAHIQVASKTAERLKLTVDKMSLRRTAKTAPPKKTPIGSEPENAVKNEFATLAGDKAA